MATTPSSRMMHVFKDVTKILAVLAVVGTAGFGLGGCSSSSAEDPPEPVPTPSADAPLPRPEPSRPQDAAQSSSSGGGMFGMFGSSGDAKGVGVNEYLWRATLDTLSFMPLENADPFGGVVKTGWYIPSQTPTERLKVTVFILDTRLRADALRVSAFKQTKDAAGNWSDASVGPDTVTKLENLILTKARELKLAAE